MNKKDKIILVTGATGHQGGAVARHLLADGWQVRAFTRNPNKPAAQTLAKLGAELVQGDLSDRTSIDNALTGVYGVFSVQQYWEHGFKKEVVQGNALADAAKSAGVQHFVYNSVASAHRNTKIPPFESKWKIEQHIRNIGLKATIIRPVFFMENFLGHHLQNDINNGTLTLALKPNTRQQMITVDDIGTFVAIAFNDPDQFIGKAIDIAGDQLTPPQIAKILGHAIGKTVSFSTIPTSQLRQAKIPYADDFATMFEWLSNNTFEADIAAIRKLNPKLKTFEAWVSQSGWRKTKAA